MRLDSQIIIASDYTQAIKEIKDLATDNEQFVTIVREGNFLVEDVKLAIEKAYLASYEKTVIILAADNFSEVVQNRLLKIIEEPPPNKEFILIFPSKSIILPTIRSRLPIRVIDERVVLSEFSLDMKNLDIRSVYDFVQEHSRVSASKARELLEYIGRDAIRSCRYKIDESTLKMMTNAIKVLDRGSPPAFVLTGVLLKLLAKKKRAKGGA